MSIKPLLSKTAYFLLAMLMTLLAGAQNAIDPSSPDTIVEVQTQLSAFGFDPGPVDGIMGRKTEQAIREYQEDLQLPVDGKISVALVESMREVGAAPPLLSEAELLALVERIALYPDDLLALVLPASTFPLELVQASRFLEKRKKDDSLKPEKNWDASVLGLLNYPEVITMMNDDLDWTEQLGTAVIDQQEDVLRAIQQFRAKVSDAGNLQSNDQVVVVKEVVEQREVIEIRSADPEVIYVPTYDPTVVVVSGYTGPPPVYYSNPYPVYYSPAATFFTGMFVGAAIGYGFNWGNNRIDYNNNININRNINVNRPGWSGGQPWRPSHRPGRPSYRPPGNRPGYRPGNRPARPAAKPAQRPANRPAQRPANRPAQRPAKRPAHTATSGAKKGNRARVDSNRGAQSRKAPQQHRSTTSHQRSNRAASQAPKRSSRQAYGGSRNGSQSRSHASRGSRSRGGGGRRR